MQNDINLQAILGPTNTGKTYLAFERLLSHKSGIFGFPLRLLARENYDKAVEKLGLNSVALITGEEKILPKEAKYYFCTVESMPLKIEVDCIAIDEVQLSSDYERGHIFTDRMLNMRGNYETIFLGSLTIEKILRSLFPNIKIQKRNRFSKLSFSPKNSLSKLNARSAIIAFNTNSVYEIAESLRAHKGGAALVLGSLSPRTRNAQVGIYEENKVDYLVATDAIGMGLNLNIDHVSFSSLQKFDGRYTRDLNPMELAQIAGRAGRHLNDGSFGYLKNAGNIDPLIIQSIEEHKFDSIKKIYWRNSNIDFSSVESVNNSLKQFPVKNIYIHKKNAEDELNFRILSKDKNIFPYLNNSNAISLLWDVCRIPDFQKIFNDVYIEFLKNIFLILIKNGGVLKEQWLQEKILKLDNYQGGIEELSIKIANIRKWTYISNQSQWIENPYFWQSKTQKIENTLSDYLHTSLTNRFVDFSASFFVNSKNTGEEVVIEVDSQRNIKLNGQNYGYINGFDLKLIVPNSESLFSISHVKRSVRKMIEEKINIFIKAPKDSINLGSIENLKLSEDVKIYWGDEVVGVVIKGNNIFSPKVKVFSNEFLDSDKKILVLKKLQDWLNNYILFNLKPISETIDDLISSEVRAFIFNIYNNLGTMEIKEHLSVVKDLNVSEKANISKSGIRVGAKFFFMPNLLKKSPMELKALLWKIFFNIDVDEYYPLPNDGRVSFIAKIDMPDTYWSAIGYICLDNFAIRVDVFERVFFLARQKIKYGPFIESSDLMNPLGCNSDQLKNIMKFCGYDNFILGDNKKLFYLNLKKSNKLEKKSTIVKNQLIKIKIKDKNKIKSKNKSIKLMNKKTKKEEIAKPDPNSPFAVLEKLL